MTKARPDKGQPKGFRSARARRLNRNGLFALVGALVIGGLTATFAWGSGGQTAGTLAGPMLTALLALTGLIATVALVALVVARRFERTDVARAHVQLRRVVKTAYLQAAPRVPVGLPQMAGSAANGDGT